MKTFRIFAENRFIMENRNYRFKKAILADIPELKEMYKATLRAINKADYRIYIYTTRWLFAIHVCA